VKTVDKTLELLDRIAKKEQPSGVVELANELGLPKSSAFRLLASLVQHGYIKQREDNRYEPTLKVWELGCMIVSRARLPQVAGPVLDQLAARTGESAQLAVLDHAESIYIDKRDGPHPIRGITRIGTRAPAHCCATGKVELAFHSPEAIRELPLRLKQFTSATFTTRKALAQELAAVRALGVAINRGEWVDDVWGVAAPIRNHTGAVCASVGVWGPRQRVSPQLAKVVSEVKTAAAQISQGLGCPGDLLQTNDRSET
jgi:DNA-binding IclR family transcriptional regulator